MEEREKRDLFRGMTCSSGVLGSLRLGQVFNLSFITHCAEELQGTVYLLF